MKVERTVPVKITRPGLSGVVQRKRLFGLLDARTKSPVVWVTSPAGSGKTTLVSSYLGSRGIPCIWYQCDEGDSDPATFFYYMGLAAKNAAPRRRKPLPLLTPEYLQGMGTFARRYFEELYDLIASLDLADKGPPTSPSLKKLKGKFAIVFDNYQDVPAGSSFHDIVASGLDIVPDNIHILVISRSDPPPQMARLNANGRIGILEYDDLRFTFGESRELVRGHIPGLGENAIKTMHENTQGWAAGIILMLERIRMKGAVTGSALDAGYDRVFDYFAGEIFEKADKTIQDFLLKTSFLPTLSVPLAEKFTGTADAERILSMLNRHNYFTERLSGSGQDYQFHPLFRKFLLERSRVKYEPRELTAIQKDAALLMEEMGQIEDAARLYLDASEGQYLARMVIRHAQKLLSQGRNKTVSEWIAGIPEDQASGNPWLLYWKAMCSFPFDMRRTRQILEKTLASFKAVDDASGQYLSWARIVDTYVFELDEWKRLDECIAIFKELKREYPVFPSREIDLIASSRMLISLIMRRTDHPREIVKWSGHIFSLLKEDPSPDIQLDIMFFISIYHLWKGDYHKNAVLLESAEAQVLYHKQPPLNVIRIKLMKGIHCWITAGYGPALQTLSEGLSIAASSGIHVFDSLLWSFRAAAEMAAGRLDEAGISLKNQAEAAVVAGKSLEIFFCHINAAWFAILAADPSLAVENLEMAMDRMDKMGNPYYRALLHIGTAQVRFLQNDAGNAMTHALTAHRIGLGMKSQVIEWYSLLIQAYFLLKEGDEKKGLPPLRRALALGRRNGYAHLEFYQPSVMRFLCVVALQNEIEPEYVKELVKKLGLTPPVDIAGSALATENWPYPIKIYTLGRFEIFKDDKPLVFPGKVQKKPLEMLKAVIAFGGRNVPVDKLTDILWPDADGDLARKSFEVTLSRLRQLLGEENLIRYSAGQLDIDRLACRIDCLELEQALTEFKRSREDRAVKLCDMALGLYKGSFLPSDAELPWTTHRREMLKNGLLHMIITSGRSLEGSGRWEQAVEYYAKGIDTDELAEEIYQHLMVCYREIGNNAEAARTYRRCRDKLRDGLGIKPSAQTEAIYSSIVQKTV
ncbi:MAG TPA: BTAD domain-containing putative transcriptional regulator [Syntrophorhabdaceae bacterium]|nr:BTAD domain-containing putative transcriptional regulator [Syntrophorhabdaceae bacterium]